MNKTNSKMALGIISLLALALLTTVVPMARAAGPCGETAYANGQEFCINLTKVIANPSAGLLKTAEPVYIAAYIPLPAGCDISTQSNCRPETLPSGYMPLCNPCFHGGGLNNFPYHDHVLSGAPGFGNDGTAGVMKGPWDIIIVAYDSAYSNKASFTPFKSMADLQAGESAGDFQVINPGAANPYEVNTGVVVIFGVQPLG